MANYCCAVRTNYFRVKDEAAFRSLMQKVSGESTVEVWEGKDLHGRKAFGFGCYGAIDGIGVGEPDDRGWYDDYDFEEFLLCLSEQVADDDAIIIMESGNEKLRYVTGLAYVITSLGYEYLDVSGLAAQRAAELLKNPKWTTRLAY